MIAAKMHKMLKRNLVAGFMVQFFASAWEVQGAKRPAGRPPGS
jgi:hypothetical protein